MKHVKKFNEDVYYPKEKTIDMKSEVERIVNAYAIENSFEEDNIWTYIRHEGTDIEIGTKYSGVSKEEWEEIANYIIQLLENEGFKGFEIDYVGDKGVRFSQDVQENVEYIKEDDGGGCAMATMGSSNGMGAVVSAQPSSIPGDVAGSSVGSGDIGSTLGTYIKFPATGSFGEKKRRKKRKKSKKNENIMITKFDKFNEECCSNPNHYRYGNSIEEETCSIKCKDCGMDVGDNIKDKKAHVYSKHWAHSTRNDEEALSLIKKLF